VIRAITFFLMPPSRARTREPPGFVEEKDATRAEVGYDPGFRLEATHAGHEGHEPVLPEVEVDEALAARDLGDRDGGRKGDRLSGSRIEAQVMGSKLMTPGLSHG
jgi:hypothetical protein